VLSESLSWQLWPGGFVWRCLEPTKFPVSNKKAASPFLRYLLPRVRRGRIVGTPDQVCRQGVRDGKTVLHLFCPRSVSTLWLATLARYLFHRRLRQQSPSGSGRAIYQAFEMVRRMGRICAIGISGREEVSVPYDRGIFKALRYDFCFSSSWTAWEKAIGMIAKGLLPAEKFITHRLPLEKWEEAFHLLENLQAAKVILIP